MNYSWPGFRTLLLKQLNKEHGISFRRSDKAFGAVFDLIARAIRRGEVVELPGLGTIKAVRRGKATKARFVKIPIGKKTQYKLLTPRPATEKKIRFKPDPNVNLE